MERVGEHPIPAGPLAVRWLAYELPELRAGAETAVRVALRNAGTATWRSRAESGVQLSYHWLDDRGNAIVWDGPRVAFTRPVVPGEEVEVETVLRAPQPPGRYRLAFDLVEELRFWFAEVGSSPLELDFEVAPRISVRRLAVTIFTNSAIGPNGPGKRGSASGEDGRRNGSRSGCSGERPAGRRGGPVWRETARRTA